MDDTPNMEQVASVPDGWNGRPHGDARPVPSLHDVDLRLLRIFFSVARNGGFSAAQIELNIAQSSISDSIARLEDRFGVTLCERGRSGFRLTRQGVELFDATRKLFQDIDEFRHRTSRVRSEMSGRIFLGIVDGIATIKDLSLFAALERLEREAPMVELELKVDSPQALIGGVQNGRYDAAVIPIFRKVPGIEAVPLAPLVPQVLYCGHGHPLFDRPDAEISKQELESAAFVARKHMEGWRYPDGLKFKERAWTNDMEGIATLILTGRYIGYLPAPYVRVWVKEGKMRPLLAEKLSYDAQLFLITRVSDITNATRFLRECL